MQSGYGGVSEIQQFMVESCGPTLFSISTANPAAGAGTPADIHSAAGPHPLKYHPLAQPQPHHHHPPQPPPPLHPHFSHFHSIPITQQLFQQPAPHQFELFHHHPPPPPPPPQQQQQQFHHHQLEPRRLIQPHQLGLDQESAPENSPASPTRLNIPGGSSGGGPSFLSAAMNFKLAVNESSGGGSREGINDDDGILQGENGSESRLHHWQREEESAIKELSWRPLDLDIDYLNRNNKRCKEKEPESSIDGRNGKFSKKSKEVAESDNVPAAGGSSNYKIFSELDAIYQPGGSGSANGAAAASAAAGGANQTGSGSALTGDETPFLHVATMAAQGLPGPERVGGTSETSAGEEATAAAAAAKKLSKGRRRRKRRQRQLSSVAAFFENLVKQLMDHQEGLHRKFLEVMERREQERSSRDEAWRKHEAAKSSSEAAARAQERALASSREAAIIAFLEKISGESLNLPSKPQFPDPDPNTDDNNQYTDAFNNGGGGDRESSKVLFNSSRWPKAEVQALIRVRSGLESRFQEPGLKGPLWEEVSAAMAVMGYQRNAKRCKEKWENINKYFRKTKESGKKRPQHSKTCPYFQQLDQLYAKSNPSATGTGNKDQRKDQNSELLDAIIVPAAAAAEHHHQSFKFSDMGFDFNGKGDENDPPAEKGEDDQNNEEEEDDDAHGGGEDEAGEGRGDDEEEEEEEGESHGGHEKLRRRRRRQLEQEEDDLHDTSLFFQRLQS